MNRPYFEDARECLYHKPSLATWTELQHVLAQAALFDPDSLGGIVEYTDEQLEISNWPDAMRRMTGEQVRRSARGIPINPTIDELARSARIDLDTVFRTNVDPKMFDRLPQLTGVSISSNDPREIATAVGYYCNKLEGLHIDASSFSNLSKRTIDDIFSRKFGDQLRGFGIDVKSKSAEMNSLAVRQLAANQSLSHLERFGIFIEGDDYVPQGAINTLVDSPLISGLNSLHFFADVKQTRFANPKDGLVESGILQGIPNLGLRVTKSNVLRYLGSECPELKHLTIRNGNNPFDCIGLSTVEIEVESLDFSATYGSKDAHVTKVWPDYRRSFLNCFKGLKRLRLVAPERFYMDTILENNPDLEDLELKLEYDNLRKLLKYPRPTKIKKLRLVGKYDSEEYGLDLSVFMNQLDVLELDMVKNLRSLRDIVIAAIQRGKKMTIVCHGGIKPEYYYKLAHEFKDALRRSSVRFIYIPKNMY